MYFIYFQKFLFACFFLLITFSRVFSHNVQLIHCLLLKAWGGCILTPFFSPCELVMGSSSSPIDSPLVTPWRKHRCAYSIIGKYYLLLDPPSCSDKTWVIWLVASNDSIDGFFSNQLGVPLVTNHLLQATCSIPDTGAIGAVQCLVLVAIEPCHLCRNNLVLVNYFRSESSNNGLSRCFRLTRY